MVYLRPSIPNARVYTSLPRQLGVVDYYDNAYRQARIL